MSDEEFCCNWEGHTPPNLGMVKDGVTDGDFLILSNSVTILTHEAYKKWLENMMTFVPQSQEVMDLKKFHDDYIGEAVIDGRN